MNDTRSRLERIQSYANLHRVAYVTTEEGAPEVEQPQPAEASTDVGADDPLMPKPNWRAVVLLAVAAFSAVAACFVIAGAAPLI